MIETLILGIFAVAASAIIGYFYGATHAEGLYKVKKCGWEISAWKSVGKDNYIVYAINGSRKVLLSLDPTGVDFDLIKSDDETR